MATKNEEKKDETATAMEMVTSSPEDQAVAEVPSNPMATLSNDDARFLAELEADINADLQALQVGEFTNPTDILGVNLNLVDCIPFEITDKATGDQKNLVMYVFQAPEDFGITLKDGVTEKHYLKDELIFVPQSSNSIRDRFIGIYDKVRQQKAIKNEDRMFALTNVHFEEMQRGGRNGNKPIALQFSPQTEKVWI